MLNTIMNVSEKFCRFLSDTTNISLDNIQLILICSALLVIIFYFIYKVKLLLIKVRREFQTEVHVVELKNKLLRIEEELKSKTAIFNYTNHEIRTIIHGISGLSQFISENWGLLDDAELRKHINSISENSIRLKNFMDELLDLLKFNIDKNRANFVEINLVNSVNQVIEQCKKLFLFNKDVKIIFNHGEIRKAIIYGNTIMIDQLLFNLFTNAIKYTNQGFINVNLSFVNDDILGWKVSISDEGIGIEDDELKSIFELFVRGSRTSHGSIGTGLGLNLCNEIVLNHKGTIWAENNNGKKGATFNFIITIFQDSSV